jgi:hypothetical protein
MTIGRRTQKFSEKMCPSATSSISSPMRPGIEPETPRCTADHQPPQLRHSRQSVSGKQINNFVFHLNTCGYSPYVTSSLTRGWVCRLKSLLCLARVVIPMSESRGIHEHILLSQIRDFPFRRLVRFAGLRWRYSTLPPHGITPLYNFEMN